MKLHYALWEPEQAAKALVLLVHGLGEHCHRYEELAQRFTDAGLAVASFDLPGHGQSEGRRGHIESFDQYRRAAMERLARAQETVGNVPVFILGHSLGGLITTHTLLEHQSQFAGAILSAPAIVSPQEPPAWQVAVIKFVAGLFPKAKMIGLDASAVSRDPAVVEKYFADPLVSTEKLSAKFLLELTKTMEECKEGCTSISLPILIMHGTADVMTAIEGSRHLNDHVSSSDKTFKLYEGLYHEIFNEPEGPQIMDEVITWVAQRL